MVPALRERREDIDLLLEHFLHDQTPPRELSDLPASTLGMLRNHDWPGNVRELRNVLTRLLLFPEMAGLDLFVHRSGAAAQPSGPDVLHLPLREARELVVEHFERRYLVARLAEHGGSVSRAAEAIGVSRQFLHKLVDRHGIVR